MKRFGHKQFCHVAMVAILTLVTHAAAAAERLQTEQLNRLFSSDVTLSFPAIVGGVLVSTFRRGGEWFLEHNPSGREAWGHWSIEDDKLCRYFEGPEKGFEKIRNAPPCIVVFRDGENILMGANQMLVTLANPSIVARIDNAPDEENKLTDSQIQALMHGGIRLSFSTNSGDIMHYNYAADGTWTVRKNNNSSEAWGTWRVDSGKLCSDLNGPASGWVGLRSKKSCQSLRLAGKHLLLRHGKWSAPVDDEDKLIRIANATARTAPAEPRMATAHSIAELAKTVPPPANDTAANNSANDAMRAELEAERARMAAELAAEREKLAAARRELQAQTQALEEEKKRQQMAAVRGSVDSAAEKTKETPTPNIPKLNFGRFHALIIGINDYESLPKLNTSLVDARAVAQLLQNEYGFKVRLLENPERSDILDAFDDLRENLTEEDNLLVYYAGHGWQDKQSERGYWLPVNASSDRRSRWFSNSDLTDALKAMLAKHVMVVADSCYSGTLTRAFKPAMRDPAYIQRMTEKRARVVLSSGGLEPVEDSGGGKHSVFAAQFLNALRENKTVIDGTQLFEQVRHGVVLGAQQTPQYSDIRFADHEGGDFLFVRQQ